MKNTSINLRLYFLLGSVVAIALVWRVGEVITKYRLSSLPVIEAPKVDIGGTSMNAKSFYPAWVKQAQAVPDDESKTVDELFNEQDHADKKKDAPPPAPDYVELFKQNVRIDGVTDTGVFLNGRFYREKEKLANLAIQGANGEQVVPVVQLVSAQKIVFRVGKETLTIRQR